jgi:hypothetical protein
LAELASIEGLLNRQELTGNNAHMEIRALSSSVGKMQVELRALKKENVKKKTTSGDMDGG